MRKWFKERAGGTHCWLISQLAKALAIPSDNKPTHCAVTSSQNDAEMILARNCLRANTEHQRTNQWIIPIKVVVFLWEHSFIYLLLGSLDTLPNIKINGAITNSTKAIVNLSSSPPPSMD